MPDPRALLVAIGVGGGVAAYTLLWWHWPLAVGIGAGILLGGLALTGTISIRAEGTVADAAWRAAAPDLQDPPAGPPADVPVSRPAMAEPAARPNAEPADAHRGRARGQPSGD